MDYFGPIARSISEEFSSGEPSRYRDNEEGQGQGQSQQHKSDKKKEMQQEERDEGSLIFFL